MDSHQMITADAGDDKDGRDPTYFSYYAQFVHQQNMLQDSVRTSLYQTAIMSNAQSLFKDKTVMDLGAGSGILSYFAVKAGADRVVLKSHQVYGQLT
jgi:type I protein arginine methyltransferase